MPYLIPREYAAAILSDLLPVISSPVWNTNSGGIAGRIRESRPSVLDDCDDEAEEECKEEEEDRLGDTAA
jgi:hypothetical protein